MVLFLSHSTRLGASKKQLTHCTFLVAYYWIYHRKYSARLRRSVPISFSRISSQCKLVIVFHHGIFFWRLRDGLQHFIIHHEWSPICFFSNTISTFHKILHQQLHLSAYRHHYLPHTGKYVSK